MTRNTIQFIFLNVAHCFDHMFILLYTTVVLALETDPQFQGSYGSLLTLSVWSFVAFGVFSLPAGWLGDKWSKPGMIVVFFLGIGLSAVATGLATSTTGIAVGLLGIGIFAAIYHPVGIAMVAETGGNRVGRALGVNGVFGNLGVASAAVVAGFLIDLHGWRAAFVVPGGISIAVGVAYLFFVRNAPAGEQAAGGQAAITVSRRDVRMILGFMFVATICTGVIFNSTTIGMPKILAERLGDLAPSATALGAWVFAVFMTASVAQVTVGYLLDRYHLKVIYIAVVAVLAPSLFFAASATGIPMVGAAMAVMFLTFGLNPINDVVVARYAAAEWRARVYAFKFLASLGVASVAVPLVGGLHEATGGFYWVFMLLCGLSLIVGLAGSAMPVKREHTGALA